MLLIKGRIPIIPSGHLNLRPVQRALSKLGNEFLLADLTLVARECLNFALLCFPKEEIREK